MNPETFTLANLFSMDLHKFIDTIGEIVTAAAKELSIERVRIAIRLILIIEITKITSLDSSRVYGSWYITIE